MSKVKHHIEEEYQDDLLSDMLEKSKVGQDIVDYRMKLAAKISKGIKAKGWSKTEFASAMGVNNTSIITKWLSGTNNFEGDTLHKIGKVLSITLLNLEADFNITSTSFVFSDDVERGYENFDLIDVAGGAMVVNN